MNTPLVLIWIRALHIIFVVCWFAGIFYLPRLFVNHAMTQDESTRSTLRLMERKLYRFMTPLAWLAVFFGKVCAPSDAASSESIHPASWRD